MRTMRSSVRRRPLKVKWNAQRGLYEPVLLEAHVVREIIDRLWLQANIKVWQINCPVGGKVKPNVSGIPDLMGWVSVYPPEGFDNKMPIPLYIEVKRPGGARRPAQERFIDEARLGGCCAFFAESWADVVKNLSEVGIKLEP